MSGHRLTLLTGALLSGFIAIAIAVPTTASAASPLGLNKTPTARIAGPTVGVHAGDTVTYSGTSSSDPDGKIASYAWSTSSNAAIVGSAASSTVSVTFNASGPTTISLTVTDNGLFNGRFNGVLNGALDGPLGREFTETASTSASFTVTRPPNRAPVFLADRTAQPRTTPRGYFVSDNVSFMDPDGDDVNIVSVACSNCRQPATIYNNANGAGTTGEQIEGYTVYAQCLPVSMGLLITIDDGHGHKLTKYRTVVVYSGPGGNCP